MLQLAMIASSKPFFSGAASAASLHWALCNANVTWLQSEYPEPHLLAQPWLLFLTAHLWLLLPFREYKQHAPAMVAFH